MPGAALLLLAALACAGLAPGGAALALFGLCAAVTHLCSALTHVYPDSHALVGADCALHWALRWGALRRAVAAPCAAWRGGGPARHELCCREWSMLPCYALRPPWLCRKRQTTLESWRPSWARP